MKTKDQLKAEAVRVLEDPNAKDARRAAALQKLMDMEVPQLESGVMATRCVPFSADCGADGWLIFEADDPKELWPLNGQCVVIVATRGDNLMTDQEDPFNPGERLWVKREKFLRANKS